MADVITLDVNEQPAVDGFENLIDEILKVNKATEELEDDADKAVSTINRIRPAAQQTGTALSQMGEKVSQLGVQFSTGSEKIAGFVPNLLRLGPVGTTVVGALGGIAAGLTILNNTGLREGKSNLDRMTGAFGDLYKSVGPTIDIVKVADDTISGISDTIVFNTKTLADNLTEWKNWTLGIYNTPGAEKFWGRQQQATQAAAEDEKAYADAARERGAAFELAGVKSQAEIDRRRTALRQERAEAYLNVQSDKERAKALEDIAKRRAALEARSLEIDKESAQQRVANQKYWAEQRLASDRQLADQYKANRDAEARAYQESVEFQKRVAKDFADYQRGALADRREGYLDTAEAIVRARAEEEKALAERLQGDARDAAIRKANVELDDSLHQLRIKRIKEEMSQQLQATKVVDAEEALRRHNQTEGDAKLNTETMRAFKQRQADLQQLLKEAQQEGAKIILDADRKLAVEEADYKRQQLTRQIQDRTEAARKQIQVEKDKKAAMEGIAKGAGEGVPGFDAAAVLKAQRPEDVKRQLMERARRDAAAGGGDKREQAEAARQAGADFAKGKVDPTKLAQAELDAANKTVGAMVAGGKVDKAVAGALANQLRIAAQQQAESDQIKKRVDEIQKIQDALINASNPAKRRSGAGGQRG